MMVAVLTKRCRIPVKEKPGIYSCDISTLSQVLCITYLNSYKGYTKKL